MKPLLVGSLGVAWIAFAPIASQAQEAGGSPAETSTEQVERCVSEHDTARQLRLEEQWGAARAAMTECASEHCPLAIGADCRAWLEELSHTLPTLLVLVERDDSATASAPRVELDGQAIALVDPPIPLELVPGPHRLRVVFPGHTAIERDFLLEKAEKNHLERITLPAPPVPARVVLSPPLPPQRPIPTATYLLSAAALGAFAGSTAFLISALQERNEAEVTCAPTCDPSMRKSIETRLVLSDLSAGAGIAFGAWALYTFVRRPTVSGAAQLPNASILASKDSLSLSWRGAF